MTKVKLISIIIGSIMFGMLLGAGLYFHDKYTFIRRVELADLRSEAESVGELARRCLKKREQEKQCIYENLKRMRDDGRIYRMSDVVQMAEDCFKKRLTEGGN